MSLCTTRSPGGRGASETTHGHRPYFRPSIFILLKRKVFHTNFQVVGPQQVVVGVVQVMAVLPTCVQVMNGMSASAAELQKYLSYWDKYKYIWENDKVIACKETLTTTAEET